MISIIISIFILPKVLSGTIPNYNQAKDSNTQIQYIEKTPSIDSCLLKSGLFTTKFLNSMDYIDIPKKTRTITNERLYNKASSSILLLCWS